MCTAKARSMRYRPAPGLARKDATPVASKKFFDREEQERHVDQVYTRAYVSSLVPLKGSELEDFMFMFRPTYAYITANNGPSLVVYVNDSYKKFMALPPEKRKMPRLVADTTQ